MNRRIENWAFIHDNILGQYADVEDKKTRIIGKLGKNTDIITSLVVGKHESNVVTLNSEYELGEVDPEYEKQYPNAKNRFINSAVEMGFK